jgi:hypothetical protein
MSYHDKPCVKCGGPGYKSIITPAYDDRRPAPVPSKSDIIGRIITCERCGHSVSDQDKEEVQRLWSKEAGDE